LGSLLNKYKCITEISFLAFPSIFLQLI